jgi:outer membrane lipoprotein-sorting protein
LPDAHYPERLAESVANRLAKGKRSMNGKRNTWFMGTAVAAAMILIMFLTLSFNTTNYAYAMEKAYDRVKAYHGILEIAAANTQGESTTQMKMEVWADKKGHYYVKQLEGTQKGLITVNNGEKKWQVVPGQVSTSAGENKVYSFPAFPDPYRFTFELGKEVEQVKSAISTKAAGEETIAGREAYILEVSPKGGEPYRIWIDKETKLPLKKQSAWNNALQYTATYTEIDFNDAISPELMAYKVPAGFTEDNSNPEFIVANIGEAQNAAGITVEMPENIPSGYAQKSIAVETNRNIAKLYFSKTEGNEDTTVVLLEGKADKKFNPVPNSILGKINNMQAEIQSSIQSGDGVIGGGPYAGVTGLSSIRWQQDGIEYAVLGNASLETLSAFAGNLAGGAVEMPSPDDKSFKPQIEVPVDMEVAENDQKSVDGGHSPWQLDPVFVAQVFVSLKISPDGIVGDYPVKMEDLKIIQNTGTEAIIEVGGEKTPVSRVYLKRLVRQDDTGIWSVTGYDPAGKR